MLEAEGSTLCTAELTATQLPPPVADLPTHLPCGAGMIANQLVCLAVWLANASRDMSGKIMGIYR